MDCLPKCEANYVLLTPLTFLKRAASVYAARTSVVYESTRFTWGQTYERRFLQHLRLASSLCSLNVTKNGIIRIPFPFGITKSLKVSILAPNIPAMYEVHFAVPMTGAILNTINTRLSFANIATILRHSGAKVFLADCELVPLACKALEILAAASKSHAAAQVIVIDDIDSPTGARLGLLEYEELVRSGDPAYVPEEVRNEWDSITLNYRSGTTSQPKEVVLILGWEMRSAPVYLRSLPMFTDGNVLSTSKHFKRNFSNNMYQNIAHMCCTPIIFNILLEDQAPRAPRDCCPPLVCEWQARWNQLPAAEQAELKACHGISTLTLAGLDVNHLETMRNVPRDRKTTGEIGWFFTGDVGIVHPDGYVEIKDRLEDVTISGGENISSLEVESVLYQHPRVLEAAVVAMLHRGGGKNSAGELDDVEEAGIMTYCRKNLAHFMEPKKVEFMAELPENHTGKILKTQLRAVAKNLVVSDKKNVPLPFGKKKTFEEVAMGLSRYEKQEQQPVLSFSLASHFKIPWHPFSKFFFSLSLSFSPAFPDATLSPIIVTN
ncbi:hypothetical protein ACJRO7_024796 [Eucalyptus globulus]|uniref:Uncharacterized protein n=1 Tax=Eucalyptus globulus TaxID=34317 RepID=A0ABD3KCS3_EUCGL